MVSFRRVAIVNRGEAAMRFVHAAREHSPEDVGGPLVTIALHTAAERRAMFVREADESVCLDDLRPSARAVSPYLDLEVLEAALVAARAEAAWVGWGFVAELPAFADLCDRLGVTFIGPPADVMRLLGDKIAAKRLAEETGFPMAPWSGGPVETPGEALAGAGAVGYPLLVKAAAGGGGRGIRRVDNEDDLLAAVDRARAEASSSFGDGTVFLERVVDAARHVEVQIIADSHGGVWAPGVRDCSLQRRNQKVIEESRSTALDRAQEELLRDAAVRITRAAGYRNAGTVEFLYEPASGQLAFLEVNTRLQVEHPVTEVTAGIDLVQLQLHVASGGRLDGSCPEPRGHAFEARLNAEDPAAGFSPAPGRIESLTLPTGPGIRVDTGVALGDEIAPEYDSMIAKIVAWGPDRDAARVRLRRALDQTTVLVRGGTTNKSFLLDVIDRSEVEKGAHDTGWLDRLTADDQHRSDRFAEAALMVAAIDAHEAESVLDRARFLGTAARGRPEADTTVGHEIELRWHGQEHRVHVATGDLQGWYRMTLDGVAADVVLDRTGDGRGRLTLGGRSHRVVSQSSQGEHLVEVHGVAHRFSRDDGGSVRAPAVSLVVSVEVRAGDEVRAGQRLVVVEAMKMETAVVAPFDGVVEEVVVAANTQVDAGAPLLRLSRRTDADPDGAGPWTDPDERRRLSFEHRPGTAARLDVLEATLLGFDVTDGDLQHGDIDEAAVCRREQVLPRELELLGAFADLCALTRDRRSADRDKGHETRSPREHFNAYLRSFDPDGEGLPDRFRRRLLDALGHYGITSLERSPELEAAVFRIHLAAQRRAEHLSLVTAMLERRLDGCGDAQERDLARDTLDRLIAATQSRYPAIGNLARSVRHRCVDRPLLDAARRRVESGVRDTVAALITAPHDRRAADALVSSPMPVMAVIAGHDALSVAPEVSAALVEVLTRRYYKIRGLQDVRRHQTPHPAVTTSYRHRGQDTRVVAASGELTGLADVLAGLVPLVGADRWHTVVDLYLRTDPMATVESVAARVETELASALLPAGVTRVAVVTVAGGEEPASTPVAYERVRTLTWVRRSHGDFVEQVVYRGLHPMIGRRLNLWRLENFDVTRLPGSDDTHIFDCVAIGQPSDERLVAVAEVRDITPLRSADGFVIALPELERVLASCLEGIRRAQAADPRRRRLEWNRVMLFVWPPVEMPLDELEAVARRLAPLTAGLGIEQVMVQGRLVDPRTKLADDVVVRLGYEPDRGVTLSVTGPPTAPMQPLDDYTQKVLQCRRRGTVYPYELVPLLTTEAEDGEGDFVEYDLVEGPLEEGGMEAGNWEADRLEPVDRPFGRNTAGIVVGVVTTATEVHPEGMARVAILGDPTKSMGSIAEAECRRILAAIDLAERRRLPIEWFALSAGARIAMDSGSENLDWVASVLRRIVEFTQTAGSEPNREVNVVVAGVNVGAQPYWNAESTMLMHTRGILVMTPESTMVLTGKQAIDFSGGVSADDNVGIGGHERVMGPNGQAQYWAPDMVGAVDVLFAHYDHSYVRPGEGGPRRAMTTDPVDRDVSTERHSGEGTTFHTVGEVFSDETNPGRKKPFDIRSVMRAVIDHDLEPLERWAEMAEAECAVVFDAHLGGLPVCLVGIESRPLLRTGHVPADGPDQWSAGTLFPLSSKKVARAVNSASGNRPVVVLANLSGFDGSPESLRRLQLEYGAEIGRAIVNFDGPIVLCVVSRYHGGAFVVFSGRLNDRMEVLAVEGSHASVIGGAPAAAVVFTREVDARTDADERVQELESTIAKAETNERAHLRAELATTRAAVRAEMLGAVAAEFDSVHSVERARDVGSVDRIIPAHRLRPELIAAAERGLTRRATAR